MPEWKAKSVSGENGRHHRDCLDAFDALRGPVHVGEPEPEREFVQGHAEGNPEYHRNAQVPAFFTTRQGAEACDHQEQNAPKEMVNVQPRFRDHVAKRTMREQLIVNDRREDAEQRHGREEDDEDP